MSKKRSEPPYVIAAGPNENFRDFEWSYILGKWHAYIGTEAFTIICCREDYLHRFHYYMIIRNTNRHKFTTDFNTFSAALECFYNNTSSLLQM